MRLELTGFLSRPAGVALVLCATSLVSRGVVSTAAAANLRDVLIDYTVTTWSQREGLPRGAVSALAQDREGYLWVGTSEGGLFRFDGVRFVAWEAIGPAYSKKPVRSLAVARDGAVWVGFGDSGGVAEIRDGNARIYAQPEGLPDAGVQTIVEDAAGTLWAGTEHGLFHLSGGKWRRPPSEDDLPDVGIYSAFVARDGALYIGATDGIYVRKRGQNRFELVEAVLDNAPAMESATGRFPRSFAEDSSGRVFVNDWNTAFHGVGDPTSSLKSRESGRGYRLFFDRRQNLWVTTIGQGLWRLRIENDAPSKSERLTSFTGLPSDGVMSLLEDREGNIWAGSTEGLSRLTSRRVTQLTDYGLVVGVELTPDGVWVAAADGLLRFPADGPEIPNARISLKDTHMRALHADERGTLWVATDHQLSRVAPGRTSLEPSARTPALDRVDLISSDFSGGVWVYDHDRGLFRWNHGELTRILLPEDARKEHIEGLYTDRKGRLWMALTDGRLIVRDGDGTTRTFGVSDGLNSGVARHLFEDRRGMIWVAATNGLSKMTGGHFVTVRSDHGLPVTNLTAITEDDVHDLWIGTGTGIARITQKDFDDAVAKRESTFQFAFYNRADGLAGLPIAYNRNRRVVRTTDGRLWFVTSRGLTVIDPRALRETHATAPLKIEYATADEHRLSVRPGLDLPRGTSRLEIAYSELNLTAPLRTRFRYRLEGFDSDWVDAGTRQQAFYTNLPPQSYRFRVLSSNADGTWAEPGASWEFSLLPIFYQTMWFQASVLVAIGLLVWGGWQMRLRKIRLQYELILGERMRLSRELHDTLLQSLVGVALQFDAVARDLDSSAVKTKNQFVRMRKQVEEYIREARQSIWDLRSPRLERRDLVATLRDLGQHATESHEISFAINVAGEPRRCSQKVEEQLLRIGQEAVTNAVRHAQATHIQMELHYNETSISLRVLDNGCGFDTRTIVNDDPQHYGLMSMRERAEEVGGQLEVMSEARHGTLVSAVVPLGGRA